MAKPASNRIPSYSDSYKDLFFGVFPELVEELTADRLKNTEISDGLQHLKEASIYKPRTSVLHSCMQLQPVIALCLFFFP